jgi:hypothetical protein
MSGDEPKQGKSRRRFLADLLFLGGSVTAASLLARSTLLESGQDPTTNPVPEPQKPIARPPDEPVAAGEMVMPEGDFVEQKVDCEPTPQVCEEPQIEGRRVAPKEPIPPHPAGAPLPPPNDQ